MMFTRIFRAVRSHKLRTLVVTFLVAFAFLNLAAFMQARAMTHYVVTGSRTESPEQLGFARKMMVLFTGVTVPQPMNSVDPTSLGLAFTTHTISSSDGVNLEAWMIRAEGSESRGLIVLLPAYATSKATCLEPARIFHDMGYD